MTVLALFLRPNSRYRQEPAGRVQTTRGPPQHFFEALSTGSQTPELLNIDMGISKVLELLSKVLEEDKSIKAEITNLRSEVRALRREMVRPVAPEASPSSIKLPLSTMEEFKLAEAAMRETPCEKQKMIITFSLIGGHTAEEAVRRMLQSGLTNNLARRFNWAGKGFKEAFKNTVLSDVMFAALQKQLPGTTHMVYSGTLKK
ncbi:hypothetical protein N1851_011075 [Merluccius polli]|uniref:DUF4806 domain-containing protein n=1 Tax=Merluccius polli TaxID=89951 RepID=A0AA47MYS2_MERPO|nr:hypothetical protein N1851_011075 [Merluccius polli]